jgi:2,4-dienoyl-CoA reductase-like NADH-dependent reductase (Old Yellow Enzyme family)/thioredoxin reductase
MGGKKFEHLLQPLEFGGIKLKNRIVMAPMATNLATEDGYVTSRLKDYYEERARGGIGLIIIEYTCMDSPVAKGVARQLCCDDDSFIPGLSELARVIQRHNVPVALQLCHAGRLASTRFTGCQPVAPSALAAPGADMPRELSRDEIDDITEKFAKAAGRAKKAGFDGVEIHCTHGYLLHQFASPISNIREDAYGGSLENRVRMILDVIRAVKKTVGKDYPIWARINAKEFNMPDGISIEESRQLAKWLEETGVVALNVSATCETTRAPLAMAWPEGDEMGSPSMAHPYGYLLPTIEKIKEVVRLPVMGVGRISPEAGEKAISQGQLDMVVIARALLCDPELPNKVASGKIEDIRQCCGCNDCTLRAIARDQSLHCSLNPCMGREKELAFVPAVKKKRVVVIGGGPAGLEAAKVAAIRGHEVVLLEQGDRLGGQMIPASKPHYKEGLLDFVDYLTTRVKKLGVKIELGKEAAQESVKNYKPDSVIVATGARRQIPDLEGSKNISMVTVEDVLEGKVRVGERVIVIGGGMVGCEAAEFLAERGKKVTLVEMMNTLALDAEPAHRRHLLNRLKRWGVTFMLQAKAVAVARSGLILSMTEGRRELLTGDTILVATRPKPKSDLYYALRETVPEIHMVGDCLEPRSIAEALLEGFRAGRVV